MHRPAVLCAGKNTSGVMFLVLGTISGRTLSAKQLFRTEQPARGGCQVPICYLQDSETPVWCRRKAGRDLGVIIKHHTIMAKEGTCCCAA